MSDNPAPRHRRPRFFRRIRLAAFLAIGVLAWLVLKDGFSVRFFTPAMRIEAYGYKNYVPGRDGWYYSYHVGVKDYVFIDGSNATRTMLLEKNLDRNNNP